MSSSLRASRVETAARTSDHVARRSDQVADTVIRSSDQDSEQSACLDHVMRVHGITNEEIATCWGLKESGEKYVRMVRENERPLTDDKFQLLPRWLRRAVLTEQSRREGLTVGKPAALAHAIESAVTLAREFDERLSVPIKMKSAELK